MILARMTKNLISFPRNYVFEKNTYSTFEELVHYCTKNHFLPELIVKECEGVILIDKRGIYLEVALEILEINEVNVLIKNKSEAELINSYKYNDAIEVRDSSKLAKQDMEQASLSRWEVFGFNRELNDVNKNIVFNKILNYFDDQKEEVKKSISYNERINVIQFYATLPKFDSVFSELYNEFIASLVELHKLHSHNGVRL